MQKKTNTNFLLEILLPQRTQKSLARPKSKTLIKQKRKPITPIHLSMPDTATHHPNPSLMMTSSRPQHMDVCILSILTWRLYTNFISEPTLSYVRRRGSK